MEILNDCTDVDEIKFQEDGTWCPMRPKKEALKVSSPCIPKIDCKYDTILKMRTQYIFLQLMTKNVWESILFLSYICLNFCTWF